jgi:hypothetical protein
LLDLGGAEKAPSDPASPQDIARQRRNWRMLDLLPDDRRLPAHIEKATDREERMKLQETLRDNRVLISLIEIDGQDHQKILNGFE